LSKDPSLLSDLEALVEPTTRGDPQSPLRWTCKGVRRLAEALQQQGHQVSHTLVAELLDAAGYRLQGNRKTKEGDSHPDRDAQFAHINTQVAAALAEQQPVISVDTRKKELVGDFRNNGREYRPQGQPEEVRGARFPDQELGGAVPYGVYDLAANAGWMSVGIDHDTAAFAVKRPAGSCLRTKAGPSRKWRSDQRCRARRRRASEGNSPNVRLYCRRTAPGW
jgi:hypothetical protein